MRLLDTDTCVEILRGNERVIERRAAVADSVATTWITASELYFGAAKSHRPENNHALVTRFLATAADPVPGSLGGGDLRQREGSFAT